MKESLRAGRPVGAPVTLRRASAPVRASQRLGSPFHRHGVNNCSTSPPFPTATTKLLLASRDGATSSGMFCSSPSDPVVEDPNARQGQPTQTLTGAVMFADISGFSPLASALSERGSEGAEELNRLLNQYYAKYVDLLLQWGGDILRFAGDATLVFWEAPNADSWTRVCGCRCEFRSPPAGCRQCWPATSPSRTGVAFAS